MSTQFNQKERVVLFGVYLAALIILQLLLPIESQLFSTSGLWFWSALLVLLLNRFVSQPYFTSPKDALSNSIASLATILPLLATSTIEDSSLLYWNTALVGTGVILAFAVLAMLLGYSEKQRLKDIATTLTWIVGRLGSSKLLFSAIFFLSLHAFHKNVEEVVLLSVVWILLVLAQPIEHFIVFCKKVLSIWSDAVAEPDLIGRVELRREPGIATIKLSVDQFPNVDNLVLMPINNDRAHLGVVLDNYRLSNALWTRVLVLAESIAKKDVTCGWGAENTAIRCSLNQINGNCVDSAILEKRKDLIGSVIERSDINLIQIEQYRDDASLAEGRLLSLKINGSDVLYQIINGETRSEALEESNIHGFTTIEARKLGRWNEESRQFEAVQWVPNIYAPAFAVSPSESVEFQREFVGHLPNTDYGIAVNAHKLVTHNTAILGILGSGKTSLALELIKRMIEDNIKVWVIDITGQYEPALRNLIHETKQTLADNCITEAIKTTTNVGKQNKADGGNHIAFASAFQSHFQAFMNDLGWRLRVFNPGNYQVTEQTSGWSTENAGINSMTSSQITRIVAEEMLKYLQNEMSTDARVCLVLEEAHSLVPEWNSVAYDEDKQATNGTAKAILQGRKYGFGCLLITQRTANVTKSILNQCNTIFGLKVFDATGIDFLSNYIGTDYANVLATLPDRQCVAYGSALNAQFPLIIELNDREVFDSEFSITNSSYLSPTSDDEEHEEKVGSNEKSDEASLGQEEDSDKPASVDDIPF